MKSILLATVAVLAIASPSFGQDQTTGQAPPSGASSFYVVHTTMKCAVINRQPTATDNMKVIGAAHSSKAEAQNALTAHRTCARSPSDGASTAAGRSVRPRACIQRARRVPDEHQHMVLNGADRDAFLAAVRDRPEPADKLVAALRRHRDLLASPKPLCQASPASMRRG
jgi:hypothetical protein